jgi:hypothetical protein
MVKHRLKISGTLRVFGDTNARPDAANLPVDLKRLRHPINNALSHDKRALGAAKAAIDHDEFIAPDTRNEITLAHRLP